MQRGLDALLHEDRERASDDHEHEERAQIVRCEN